MVHIADADDEPARTRSCAVASANSAACGPYVAVPMLKDDELIGVIIIYRQEVRPFTDKQIELVQNFAAQAVIAIENTRLLNELRESLAAADRDRRVLKVISSSPGELEPVFEAMLENAVRDLRRQVRRHVRCATADGFRCVAMHGAPPALVECVRGAIRLRPDRRRALAALIKTKQVVQIADMQADPAYLDGDPLPVAPLMLGGARTSSPCRCSRTMTLIGAIVIYRQEVRPFTDKQIELVQNFAAQAVIAIENTRLLNELRAIARSSRPPPPTCSRSSAARPSICRRCCKRWSSSAARLCDADMAPHHPPEGWRVLSRRSLRLLARIHGIRQGPCRSSRSADTASGRALLEGKVVHIPDVLADPEYTLAEAQRLGGFRTMLGVPMLREGVADRRPGA